MALQQFNVSLEKELKLKKIEKGLSAAYAKLASHYRNCNEREVVAPADFKAQMGRRKDRFAGSAQQDAQEFLTAFLEGINEEMTRVKVKPKYKELQGDPSKDALRNIVQYSLCRLINGGTTANNAMTPQSATTSKDKANAPFSVLSANSDQSASTPSGDCL